MTEENETAKKTDERFNNIVAATIAILATFMAISAIKGSNVAQGIQEAQVERNDNWAWYQAVRVREDMATYEMAALQRLARTNSANVEDNGWLTKFARKQPKSRTFASAKMRFRAFARGAEARMASLNVFDDQYDISTALISIAVSLLALCVLVQTRWLYWFSLAPAIAGLGFGGAAMAGMPMHAEVLIHWLG